MELLLVIVGGALGVGARYGLSVAIPSLWTIVAINLAGCFVLGWLTHVELSKEVRDGIGVGLLGGFTTFSTFGVQTVLEAEGGRIGLALAYAAVSVAGGLGMATLGYVVGRVA